MILLTTLVTLSAFRISAVVLTNQLIEYSARKAGKENRKKATFFRFLYITKIQHYFEQKKCLNQIVFLFFVGSTFTMTSFTTSSYKMNPLLFGV